ncbi:MAG: acyl carrier protein [Phycisphaerae bacterium]
MDDNGKFRSIVSTILQVPEDQVSDDLTPEKIDTWDSLNHINLIGALEQEFNVTLNTETIERSRSIPRLRALLAEQGIEV